MAVFFMLYLSSPLIHRNVSNGVDILKKKANKDHTLTLGRVAGSIVARLEKNCGELLLRHNNLKDPLMLRYLFYCIIVNVYFL